MNNSIKTNTKLDNQRLFDYCMYMMLTSYFNDVKVNSRNMEDKLFQYYKITDSDKQVDYEYRCERIIESVILPSLPSEFLNQKVQCFLKDAGDGFHTRMTIISTDYLLEITTNVNNRKRPVTSHFYVKRNMLEEDLAKTMMSYKAQVKTHRKAYKAS